MNKQTAVTLFMNTLLGLKSPEFYNMINNISSLIKVGKKTNIFFEGDSGNYFYFLVSGKVKLFKMSSAGKEVVVKIISPGEIFAEIAIIESRYPVTALTLENCLLLKIDAQDFFNFLENDRELNRKFMFMLLQRIKTLLSRLELIGTESVEERVYHYLRELALKRGENFTLPISKGELATLLFTSPETISRTFAKLKEKGLIEVNGKRITVKKF